MRQLRRKLHRGKDLRIFCVKSWSLATLILTAVYSIVVPIVIALKELPSLKFLYISYAVWAFQCSNMIISSHYEMQLKNKNVFIFIKLSAVCTDENIFKKVFLFYLVSLFACLQSLWIYHIWICLLILYYSDNELLFYCAVWRAFCCTNVWKCYMCFFMHIQSILHFKSNINSESLLVLWVYLPL